MQYLKFGPCVESNNYKTYSGRSGSGSVVPSFSRTASWCTASDVSGPISAPEATTPALRWGASVDDTIATP